VIQRDVWLKPISCCRRESIWI